MASHGSDRHDPPASPADHEDTEARLPQHVYRRRRLVALGVVVLLLLLLVWGVTKGVRAVTGAGDAPDDAPATAQEPATSPQVSADPAQKFADFTPRPSPSGSASPGGSAGPSASSTAAAECQADLSVRASTSKESYAGEEEPVLTMTLENTGEQPCTVNAGTKLMAFVVTSGADTVFDSRHCAAGGEDRKVTLAPGQKETSNLTWNRVRTAEGCPAGQPKALAGYYNLAVSLGETTSEQAAFVLQ
ncbi:MULTISPECIES: DUF4232 domain-containing protein [Kocuria]|uniref:DUF4232 domain-containing protein n=1 Tax=Kocuria TaxID=57493 RepID=UPI0008A5FE36|nr:MULTISPECIES: DUF4232 domain-containing protein [Kocuria]MCT1881231.1 DUF4232 domain-containing protein [Kocuria rhizophila]OFK06970.1 hypothetical protein HMPREF2833_03170 [Kocuria sp. HMSC066H03]PKZ37660.1 DUF4232 domain-containing protein [Kocuria rhizophila]